MLVNQSLLNGPPRDTSPTRSSGFPAMTDLSRQGSLSLPSASTAAHSRASRFI
jgi:hypothetical protein